MNNFDPIVQGALEIGQSLALKSKNSEFGHYHLFWGLISHPESISSKAFKDNKKELKKILASLPTLSTQSTELRPSSELSRWLTHSSSHAIQEGRKEVSERDLLKFMPEILKELNLDYSKIKDIQDNEESEVPHFLR